MSRNATVLKILLLGVKIRIILFCVSIYILKVWSDLNQICLIVHFHFIISSSNNLAVDLIRSWMYAIYIDEDCPPNRALGTPLMTFCQEDKLFCRTTLCLCERKNNYIQNENYLLHLQQESLMRHCIKSFCKVDHICFHTVIIVLSSVIKTFQL